MTAGDLLAGAEPRSPRALLDELAARARRAAARGRERPDVALHLTSGAVIAGRLVAVGDDRGTAVVMLHVGGPPTAPRVAAIRVDQVIAVIHDLVREVVDHGPAPGRLEVLRAWAAQAAPLAAALGIAIELVLADDLDDAGRRAAATTAPILGQLLRELAGDDLGREALLMCTAIRLGASRGGSVRKDGSELVVEVPDDPDRAWSAADLRAEVEKAL